MTARFLAWGAIGLVSVVGAYLLGLAQGRRGAPQFDATPGRHDGAGRAGAHHPLTQATSAPPTLHPAPSGSGVGAGLAFAAEIDRMKRGGELSGDAIAEAVRRALKAGDPVEARLALAKVLESLTAANAQAAIEAFREAPGDDLLGAGHDTLASLCFAWGALDGEAAAAFGAASDDDDMAAAAVAGWAATDPAAAIAWVESAPEEVANDTEEGLVFGLAQSDLAQATRYVLDRAESEGFDADDAMQMVAWHALRQGLEPAAAWVESLPDGEAKASAFEVVAERYWESDRDGAVAWVARHAAEPSAVEVVAGIADEIAGDDLDRALEWTAALPPGASQSRAYAELMDEWAEHDAVAASEFLATLPPGSDRDRAVTGFARQFAEEDPSAAITWAESIKDQDLRRDTLFDTARALAHRDPAAAAEYLATSDLPIELQERIVREVERRDRDR